MKKVLPALVFALFVSSSSIVFASDEKFWDNHYYEMVSNLPALSWDKAVTDASGRTYNGIQGHLVTVTSSEESNALTGFLKEWNWSGNRWTGAYQEPGTGTSNLGWKWITGEEFHFTNWNIGEPNDATAGIDSENNMTISTWFDPAVGTWYDAPGNPGYVTGYIAEYDDFKVNAVPEPVSSTLFLIGGGVMATRAWWGRRRESV